MTGFTGKLAAALTLSAAVSLPAIADDLVSAANDMCENVKACSMAQIAESEMTPEMRQMMEPMLESMCDQMRQGVQQVPSGHDLYQPSVDCMRSMADLTCDEIMNLDTVETPACKKYRELAETAYEEYSEE
jgi:hypothetical protein